MWVGALLRRPSIPLEGVVGAGDGNGLGRGMPLEIHAHTPKGHDRLAGPALRED